VPSVVEGSQRIRRLLGRLPEQVKQQLRGTMETIATQELAQMKARAPRGRTGKVVGALSKAVLGRTLNNNMIIMQVGMIDKALYRKAWYARVIEFGRKAKVMQTRKVRKKRSYTLRVAAMAPRPFVHVYANPRAMVGGRLDGVWRRALERAATGVG